LFLTFVFSPWDYYSLGQKNNNTIYKAPRVGQSWVLLKSHSPGMSQGGPKNQTVFEIR